MTKPTAKTKKPAPKAHPKTELQKARHLEARKQQKEKRKLETAKAGQTITGGVLSMLSLKGDGWQIDAQTDKNPCKLSFLINKNGPALSFAIFRAAWKILTGQAWAQTCKDATKKGKTL